MQEVPVKYNYDYIEGLHYYLEDGNKVVFTELFHKQRGKCCGAVCKHCPFHPQYKKGETKLKEEEKKENN